MFRSKQNFKQDTKFFIGDVLAILTGFDLSSDAYLGALKLAKHIQHGYIDAAMSDCKPYLEKLFPELEKIKNSSPSMLRKLIKTMPEKFVIIIPMDVENLNRLDNQRWIR